MTLDDSRAAVEAHPTIEASPNRAAASGSPMRSRRVPALSSNWSSSPCRSGSRPSRRHSWPSVRQRTRN